MDAEGKGGGGMNWESGIDAYICKIYSWGELRWVLRDELSGWDGQGWEGGPGNSRICRHIADPCCCAAETNNIVQQACSNKKIIKIITHKIVSEVLKVLLDINS